MEAVLEEEFTVPFDDMCEQITKEGGIFGKQGFEVESALRGDKVVEANLARREVGPLTQRGVVVGVGTSVAHTLKDHPSKFIGR